MLVNNKQFLMLAVTIIVSFACFHLVKSEPIKILFTYIDDDYKVNLIERGYQVGLYNYHDFSLNNISKYNVLVVSADSIGEDGIANLISYAKGGGGLIIYSSMKYGWNTYHNQLTSSLASLLGIKNTDEELKESKEKEMTSYCEYWWTTEITNHAITAGINKVYYADYNLYPHVVIPDDSWNILVKSGEYSTSTGGTYTSYAPLVMYKEYGRGKIIYMTSYILSSYSSSCKTGLLWKGDNEKLMLNAYNWVAGSYSEDISTTTTEFQTTTTSTTTVSTTTTIKVPYCGDGKCDVKSNYEENCLSCPADCGNCPTTTTIKMEEKNGITGFFARIFSWFSSLFK